MHGLGICHCVVCACVYISRNIYMSYTKYACPLFDFDSPMSEACEFAPNMPYIQGDGYTQYCNTLIDKIELRYISAP